MLNWRAWDRFVLREILPDADKVDVVPYQPITRSLLDMIPSYDVLILNLDLTDCRAVFSNQDELLEIARSNGVLLFNQNWLDLDKVRLQEVIQDAGLPSVAPTNETPQNALVIVKTRQNYGGEPERLLQPNDAVHSLVMDKKIENSRSYFVTTWRDVQKSGFDNGRFCVELFKDNPEGLFFRVYVAGLAVLVVRAYSNEQIKKITDDPRDENCFSDRQSLDLLAANPKFGPKLALVIEALLEHRPVDFCSLDVMTDGRDCYLVDFNTTPWCGDEGLPVPVRDFLKAGLDYRG